MFFRRWFRRTVRFEILLPLQYNDGTPVEPEKIALTRRELREIFGASTLDASPLRGQWLHEGTLYEDDSIRLYVDTDNSRKNIRFFRRYKEKLKRRFRQIDI
jgi:hypothetical protein